LAARRLYLPDRNFSSRLLDQKSVLKGPWFRVHPSGKSYVYFSKNAANRYTPDNSPFGVLYGAVDIETALFEVFGDEMFENDHRIRAFRWKGYSISRVLVPQVRVCALADNGTRASLKVDLGTLMGQDFTVTRAWALAIMDHPAQVHGLIYTSRFTQRHCLALFDRGSMSSQVSEDLIGQLHAVKEANQFLDDHRCVIV